jgi:hypothetical protein
MSYTNSLKADLTCYRPGSLSINSSKPAGQQEVSRGMLQLVTDVSYDMLFAVIVIAHPVWVCLLTVFVFAPVS